MLILAFRASVFLAFHDRPLTTRVARSIDGIVYMRSTQDFLETHHSLGKLVILAHQWYGGVMDIGAALSALLVGLALTGYAYRAELTRLDYWLLGHLRAIHAQIWKFLKPYRYKPRHDPKNVAEILGYQGRHFHDETKPYYTYVRGARVVMKPVHA